MTKRIALFLLLAMMATVHRQRRRASNTTVKGVCKDENGKPIAGATIELNNLDNGSKIIRQDRQAGHYLLHRRTPPETTKSTSSAPMEN